MSKLTSPHNTIKRSQRLKGFSYVEVLLAAMIMSILMVSAVRLFGNLGRSGRDTTDQAAAAELAIQMIEEIKSQQYKDPNAANEFGPGANETGETRIGFDDIDDYQGWSACPVETRRGGAYDEYPHLTRSVTVRHVAADDFTHTVSDDQGFKEVTITVSNGELTLAQQKYVIANTQP